MKRTVKNKLVKYACVGISLLLAVFFIARFGAPSILRLYVEVGIGTCQKIPALCIVPTEDITDPDINTGYVSGLLPYSFPKMDISVPRGFAVNLERITKVYYKKRHKGRGAIIYLLSEGPDFFIKLFPPMKKQGIKDDYEFIKRVAYADLHNIKNLTDAFFVIMKSIFTPDMGNQKDLKIAQLTMPHKRGFLSYTLSASGNYFNCDLIDDKGYFFKIYIRDTTAALDRDKVLAMISTIERP
ncbi:MAG: hypothetical protein PHF11_06900 [Candidatus Omnitrophica bacterium]|nr:hypothetical protein [Candidatus Omnitrophota bacterium]